MSWRSRSIAFSIACVLAIGCGRSIEKPQAPTADYKFLGIPDNETSAEGPVGLINGQSYRVSTVSKVQEASFAEYKRAMDGSKIIAEEEHNGFVYWAVKEQRDVPFENATAWVTVLERFKSRIE